MVGTLLFALSLLPDSMSLGEVTVTGHRQLITSQSIRGEELQKLNTTTVADAIKLFAGTQIKDYGGLGGVKTVNVRSLGAQHTSIFLDGVKISNAQNGTVDLGKFSVSALESISLFNASKVGVCQSASEYASGASIYLRTVVPTFNSTQFTIKYGSFDTYLTRFSLKRAGKISTLFDTEFCTSSGKYPYRYKSEYEDTVGIRENSYIRYFRANLALNYKDLNLRSYYYNSVRGIPGGVIRRLSDKFSNVAKETDVDAFTQLTKENQIGKLLYRVQSRFSYELLHYRSDFEENRTSAHSNNKYHQYDGYISLASYYSGFVDINTSVDTRLSSLESDLKKFTTVTRWDTKVSLDIQKQISSITLRGILLYQHYKDYRAITGAASPLNRFTPTFIVTYNTKLFLYKLWYKSIFRVPTLNDLYYTQAGNRNLKPETADQLNLGIERTTSSYRIQADVYINKVKDRIVCVPMRGVYTWTMLNYGKTFCIGLNTNFSYNYKFLHLTNTITLQDDVNKTKNTAGYNKQVCYSPIFSTGTTLSATIKSVDISLSHQYVSKRIWSYASSEDYLKPYSNLDLRIRIGLGKLTTTLDITDVFDTQYEHIPRYPLPGRTFNVSLNYNLN